ncbi:MarR family winged helix-turn-helix transcriptional regulator [Herbiconiux sp. P18]|uniref:MarR family winged helix-turn-helix transcriptional regulator n=1 Tax=Herbiconiux liangxiaofengii TaxID=3342795 RepID=UPI0035B6D22B
MTQSTDEDVPDVGATIEAAMSAILRWTTRSDNRRALQDAAGAALSSTDSWLLEYVVASGPVRMSALAEWLSVDKSTVTAEVRRLENGGLVTRRPDEDDRRAVLVTATDAGRVAIQRHHASAQQVYNTLVGKWAADDRAELARLLDRFVDELSWVSDAVSRHNASRPQAPRREKGHPNG